MAAPIFPNQAMQNIYNNGMVDYNKHLERAKQHSNAIRARHNPYNMANRPLNSQSRPQYQPANYTHYSSPGQHAYLQSASPFAPTQTPNAPNMQSTFARISAPSLSTPTRRPEPYNFDSMKANFQTRYNQAMSRAKGSEAKMAVHKQFMSVKVAMDHRAYGMLNITSNKLNNLLANYGLPPL